MSFQCDAITSQGMRCQVRSRNPGPCTVHSRPKAQRVDAKAYIHRCAARTINNGLCFVRVRAAGDMCPTHRDAGSLDQMWATVGKLRAEVERMSGELEKLRGTR